jgi:inner membrane protein
MDILTHGLIGATLSGLFLKRVDPTIATVTLISSSVIPDIDYVVRFWGMTSYLKHHRGITHSILGVLVLSLILAALVKVFSRSTSYWTILLFCFLGSFIHLFFDLTNAYGTQILLPFSKHRYHWDWLMLIDLPIFSLLLVGLIVSWIKRPYAFQIAATVLVIIALYIGFRAVVQAKAENWVKNYPLQNEEKIKYGAYPAFFPPTPFKWWTVMETKDAYYVGNLDLLDADKNKPTRVEKIPKNGWVEIAKKTETARVFLDFAKYPHLEIYQKDGNWVIEWDDLTFGLFKRKGFLAQVVISEDEKILSQSFRY